MNWYIVTMSRARESTRTVVRVKRDCRSESTNERQGETATVTDRTLTVHIKAATPDVAEVIAWDVAKKALASATDEKRNLSN